MAETKTPRINQTRWSSGQDVVKREDFDSDAANLDANVAIFKEGTLAERPAAGVRGRFYTVVNDSAENNGKQFYDNGVEWSATKYTTNQLAEAVTASDTALTVRAQSSPTVDIFQVQDSAGADVFRVTAAGYFGNKTDVENSPGARFGYRSTHANTGYLYSVGAGKPVLVVRGAAGQTANLQEFRDGNNVLVAQVDRSGGATFNGGVVVGSLTSNGTISAPRVNITGSANFIDATVAAGASNHVALSVRSFNSSQSVNLSEYYSAQGTRTARILGNGTVALDGRLLVGGEGDSGTQTYPNSVAVAQIRNTMSSSTPVMNLIANQNGQTGKMFQTTDSNNTVRFWVDNSGAMYASGNANLGTAAVGTGVTSPTPYYNSYTPRFEVLTGTSSGSYDESISLRHPTTGASAVNRRVGLRMKLSNENNQTESNKWAGVYAVSNSANATQVGLEFWANGTVAGSFDHDKTLNLRGGMHVDNEANIRFGTSAADKIYLTDTPETNVIGQQNGGTVYVRSNNFAIYSGGTFHPDALNNGTGGLTMASFTPARTTVRRLTISSETAYNSTEPMLQLGTQAHMQFSPYSINSYDDENNNVPAEVNIANNGGRVRLGNTSSTVSMPSRKLWVGNIDDAGAANCILFARSSFGSFQDWVGRTAQNGDWWLDHTTNRIGVHTGTEWRIFMPHHSASSIDG